MVGGGLEPSSNFGSIRALSSIIGVIIGPSFEVMFALSIVSLPEGVGCSGDVSSSDPIEMYS